ncbi:MAG: hypothetical protein WCO98_17040 [bacterium]
MKQTALKIINPILMLSFFVQFIAVGILVLGEKGSALNKIAFPLHQLNGQILLVLAVIHLIYNWNWVKAMFKGAKS